MYKELTNDGQPVIKKIPSICLHVSVDGTDSTLKSRPAIKLAIQITIVSLNSGGWYFMYYDDLSRIASPGSAELLMKTLHRYFDGFVSKKMDVFPHIPTLLSDLPSVLFSPSNTIGNFLPFFRLPLQSYGANHKFRPSLLSFFTIQYTRLQLRVENACK